MQGSLLRQLSSLGFGFFILFQFGCSSGDLQKKAPDLNSQSSPTTAPPPVRLVPPHPKFQALSMSRLLWDSNGNAIDAHDGKLLQFDDPRYRKTFYLYGTSYGCGFEWKNPEANFCGFKVYSSQDLEVWKDEGYLFDYQTNLWQSRCDGNTYGCFRPHVLFNSRTQKYILWINSYDIGVGYHVLTSSTPTGPFEEVSFPVLAVNSSNAPGVNNGDFDLFQDEDGEAYIAYTDWVSHGDIVVEHLNDDFTSGTGEFIRLNTHAMEAPSLFRYGENYYLTVSDPNTGYSIAGTSYFRAKNPLGPWSKPTKISSNSCGGQPSAVSRLHLHNSEIFLYQSDLWHNLSPDPVHYITLNQSLAGQFWSALQFSKDGSIEPIQCVKSTITTPTAVASSSIAAKITTDLIAIGRQQVVPDKYLKCDIGENHGAIERLQVLRPTSTSILQSFSFLSFQLRRPKSDLKVYIFSMDRDGNLENELFTTSISSDQIPWSASKQEFYPRLKLRKGRAYALVLSSESSSGCFGTLYRKNLQNADLLAEAKTSYDGGKTWEVDPDSQIDVHLNLRAVN